MTATATAYENLANSTDEGRALLAKIKEIPSTWKLPTGFQRVPLWWPFDR